MYKCGWCVRGDMYPDAVDLVRRNETASPTMSTAGKGLVLQSIASFFFLLEMGDIKGAFLEAGKLNRLAGDLWCELPKGGLPGSPRGP